MNEEIVEVKPPLKIEIGGGIFPKGDGYINVDQLEIADVRHNLNILPWPFEDAVAEALYSSHCIEHVGSSYDFLRECARVCKIGAHVEIRCPDACGEMAMCPGHTHVISIDVMRHASDVFPKAHWKGTERRLRMISIEPGCDDYWFPLARSSPLFAGWTDIEILTWLPRTRHENRFHFVVEATPLDMK